jgi:4'-phosphopantetheinyl transferase
LITSTRISLADDEAHLWDLCPEAIVDPATIAGCLRVLGEEERDQQRRFARAEDRHLYLVTHAAVRRCLARYVDVPPAAFVFERNDHGRPEVAAPHAARALRFNLSHTRGLAMIAVAREREIGVDVEDTSRSGEVVESLAERFAPNEVRELAALPPARRRQRFFELWTLKEAYGKARGLGLSLPLDQVTFQIVSGCVAIRFAPVLVDDPRSWQLVTLAPSPTHCAAVALRRAPGEEIRLTRCREG